MLQLFGLDRCVVFYVLMIDYGVVAGLCWFDRLIGLCNPFELDCQIKRFIDGPLLPIAEL